MAARNGSLRSRKTGAVASCSAQRLWCISSATPPPLRDYGFMLNWTRMPKSLVSRSPTRSLPALLSSGTTSTVSGATKSTRDRRAIQREMYKFFSLGSLGAAVQSFVFQHLHDLGDRDGGRGKGCDKRSQLKKTRQCRAQLGQRAPLARAAFDS